MMQAPASAPAVSPRFHALCFSSWALLLASAISASCHLRNVAVWLAFAHSSSAVICDVPVGHETV